MNKNILTRIVLMGLLATSTISCEDLLDTEPRQSITPELALSDLSGYEGLLFSTYSRLKRFNHYGQTMMVGPEILADNLVLVNRTGRYEGQFENAVGSHIDIWSMGTGADAFNLVPSRYQAINELNQIIVGIDAMEGEEARKNQIKGEAYFLRALCYHDLHKIYSYEPGQEVNGFNLGVILRTEPVTAVTEADQRERSTNVEGYQLMESDLQEAIRLLPATADDGPYRAAKPAAQALLSRVYLYWGNWAQAVSMADAALAGTSAKLTSGEEYVESWAATPHPESLLEIELVSVDWNTVDGVNNSMQSMTQPDGGGQFVVGLSPDLVAAHEEGDIRAELWDSTSVGGQDQFMSLKWPGEKGVFLENLPILRYSEVLLIRAEAKAHSGDAAGAREDLNAFRAARGLDEVSASLSGNGLIDRILDERRKEFVLEGHRFFDLKRLGRDITKPERAENSSVPYDNYRVLAPIPFAEVRLNENLTQNPGYNN